jgi:large subunit ribosomal protein L5
MTERRSKRAPVADAPVSVEEAPITTDEAPSTADEASMTTEAPSTADEAPITTEAPTTADQTPEATEEAAAPAADVVADEASEAPIAAAAATPAAPDEAPAAAPEPEPEARPRATRDAAPVEPRPSGPRGLRARYLSDVVPALTRQFEYANPNMVPRVDKIVVNVGIGEALTNAKAIDSAAGDLAMITGQKPIVMKARRSIAQFRVRTGNPIGLKVTLRGQRMWDFLERLTMLTLPRIRDFRGTPGRSFDGRGNYTLGLREQIAFPEIDYDKVDRLRGLEVSIVTTAKSDEESKRLLELLGMPFAG